jgi:hypothetical protein
MFLIQQVEPLEVIKVKEELTEEITVEECYACHDK